MQPTNLIEAAVRNEEWLRSQAAPEHAHFWDGWDADLVRTGSIVATVTTSAPGTGHNVVITAALVVQVDGKSLAYVPDTETVERVSSRTVRRAGGLEAYSLKLAAKLYGAKVPVKTKHHA